MFNDNSSIAIGHKKEGYFPLFYDRIYLLASSFDSIF